MNPPIGSDKSERHRILAILIDLIFRWDLKFSRSFKRRKQWNVFVMWFHQKWKVKGEYLMPKPITPMVGCDVFVLNENSEVLLIQRSDNGLWALPGGCHDLGETPRKCAERECREESGYEVEVTDLLGVYSSNCYEYVNYPWKENEFCHILFKAKLIGGHAKSSSETTRVGWFNKQNLPPFSDGHEKRVQFGFVIGSIPNQKPYFE